MAQSLLAATLVATLGCGGTGTSPNDAAADASVPGDLPADCQLGPVPLSYFTDLKICAAHYSDALSELTCRESQGECAGHKVIGFVTPVYRYDCFYDAVSGALVGADSFSDEGQNCIAGSAHAQCGTVHYSSGGTCDGGTP